MDDDVKQKQNELTDMIRGFCRDKLDGEYEDLCVKLVEKMGRKHNVPFKRGKLENWASGIVYAIGQINFLFDDSFYPYATPDDICSYFKTKKSTASNKARDIHKMFNLKPGNKEFSTEIVKDYDLSGISGDLSQIKTLHGAGVHSTLRQTAKMIRQIHQGTSVSNVNNDDLRSLIKEIFDSPGDYISDEHIERLNELVRSATFISPACGAGILYISDMDDNVLIPAFTSMDEYNIEFVGANIEPVSWNFTNLIIFLNDEDLEGIVINPQIDNFFVSRDMIIDMI